MKPPRVVSPEEIELLVCRWCGRPIVLEPRERRMTHQRPACAEFVALTMKAGMKIVGGPETIAVPVGAPKAKS